MQVEIAALDISCLHEIVSTVNTQIEKAQEQAISTHESDVRMHLHLFVKTSDQLGQG